MKSNSDHHGARQITFILPNFKRKSMSKLNEILVQDEIPWTRDLGHFEVGREYQRNVAENIKPGCYKRHSYKYLQNKFGKRSADLIARNCAHLEAIDRDLFKNKLKEKIKPAVSYIYSTFYNVIHFIYYNSKQIRNITVLLINVHQRTVNIKCNH